MTGARRLPLGATLLTLVMLPVLLWLSYWQLAVRRSQKHALIAVLAHAPQLPPVAPREFSEAMAGRKSVQYRRATIDCRPGRVAPYDSKGGTSAAGEGGFLVLVACRTDRAPDIVVVAGWTLRPDVVQPIVVDTSFTGTIIEHPYGTESGRPQFMLIPTTAIAPLLPSLVPVPDDLPDNHLSYGLQWLAFAATLAVIYALYVRRWRRERG